MPKSASKSAHIVTWATVGLLASLVAFPANAAVADDAADITWSVTPATESGPDQRGVIQQELDPGATADDYFAVRNLSRIEVTFSLSAADGYYTDTGRFNMLPSDQESVDAGTWIDLPDTVTVGPNATVVVPFTTTVPDDAIPGDHAAGIAASVLSTGTDAGGSSVGVESRVGFRVLTRVTGDIVPSVEVAQVDTSYAMSWNPFRPGSGAVTFEVRNTGNASVVVAGVVSAGTGSAEFPGADEPRQELLPGESRRFTTAVTDVWPTFVAPVSVALAPTAYDFGGDPVAIDPLVADATMWAIPIPQLVVLLGVGLILAAMFWGRRRSRRKLEAALAAAREEGMAAASQTSAANTMVLGDHPTEQRKDS